MKPYRFTTCPTSAWWVDKCFLAIWWCGADVFDDTIAGRRESAIDDIVRAWPETSRERAGELVDESFRLGDRHR